MSRRRTARYTGQGERNPSGRRTAAPDGRERLVVVLSMRTRMLDSFAVACKANAVGNDYRDGTLVFDRTMPLPDHPSTFELRGYAPGLEALRLHPAVVSASYTVLTRIGVHGSGGGDRTRYTPRGIELRFRATVERINATWTVAGDRKAATIARRERAGAILRTMEQRRALLAWRARMFRHPEYREWLAEYAARCRTYHEQRVHFPRMYSQSSLADTRAVNKTCKPVGLPSTWQGMPANPNYKPLLASIMPDMSGHGDGI